MGPLLIVALAAVLIAAWGLSGRIGHWFAPPEEDFKGEPDDVIDYRLGGGWRQP